MTDRGTLEKLDSVLKKATLGSSGVTLTIPSAERASRESAGNEDIAGSKEPAIADERTRGKRPATSRDAINFV